MGQMPILYRPIRYAAGGELSPEGPTHRPSQAYGSEPQVLERDGRGP